MRSDTLPERAGGLRIDAAAASRYERFELLAAVGDRSIAGARRRSVGPKLGDLYEHLA